MKRFLPSSLLFLLILSACLPTTTTPIIPTHVPPAQPTETSKPPTSQPESTPTLKRGVSIGDMLEAPNEGDWGLTVYEEYFDLIKQAGFDFAHLPVNWKEHTKRTSYERDTGCTIDWAFFLCLLLWGQFILNSEVSIQLLMHPMFRIKYMRMHIRDPLLATLGQAQVYECILNIIVNTIPVKRSVTLTHVIRGRVSQLFV